ncbi:MAG: hypothetical protein ACLTLQ_12705 [[Clostridium] scindens]
MILGLTQTDSGRIIFEGKDLTDVLYGKNGDSISYFRTGGLVPASECSIKVLPKG